MLVFYFLKVSSFPLTEDDNSASILSSPFFFSIGDMLVYVHICADLSAFMKWTNYICIWTCAYIHTYISYYMYSWLSFA